MLTNLLPALLLLAIPSGALSYGHPQTKLVLAAGPSATLPLSKPGSAAPRQQAPVPKQEGATPHQPTKPPPHMPAKTAELPEEITLNSICLLDNVYGVPVMYQAELRGSTPQQFSYSDKNVVDVPDGDTKSVIFSIWLKNNKKSLIRCPLSRGNSYQVFIKKNKLAVAPILGG